MENTEFWKNKTEFEEKKKKTFNKLVLNCTTLMVFLFNY